MADEPSKKGGLARRREQQRLKRERTGDSPQKRAERGKGGRDLRGGTDTQPAVDAIDEYARHMGRSPPIGG